MGCYRKETIHYKYGLFDNMIDAVYVLTMEDSTRRNDYMYQLEMFKPCSKVHIMHNKGYKKCEKKLCDKDNCFRVDISYKDITHAYMNTLKDAKKNNYKNILILEDDFIFSSQIKNQDTIFQIETFLKSIQNTNTVYHLGTIPIVSTYYGNHRKIIASIGCHAVFYNSKSVGTLLKNEINIDDFDLGLLKYVKRYCYHEPLAYQTFDETDNNSNWGKFLFLLGYILRFIAVSILKLLNLDKKVEPGTSRIYNFNKFVYDLLIPYFIFYFIVKKYILK